jgi:alpha-beta hydrolase superfamily lysophospholipase
MPTHALTRKNFNIRLAVILSALAALLGLALASDARAAHATPFQVGPKGEAFYQPPSELPKGHGKVIWMRKAQSLVDAGDDATSYKLLYTSKSPQREQVAISGSVAFPNGKPPKGGWPVITWDHGTTGLADSCAPSKYEDGTQYEPFIDEWLKMGYAVVRTDYQGLGTPGPHPYLIGKSAGRSALDIIAAARQFAPLGKDYLIAGHSQGGHAALWTAGWADWQPDLDLHGTVAFAPASHLKEQISLLPALTSPNPLSALAVSILAGASTANPRIDPAALLNPEPLALYPEVEEKCLGELGQTDSLGGIPPSELLQDGANLGPLEKVLARNNPDVSSDAPILVVQGTADTTVFPTYTEMLVDELSQHNDVEYAPVPGANHGSVMVDGMDEAEAFFDANLPAG